MTDGTKSLLAVLGIFVTVALSIVLIGAANKVRQSQVVGGAPCPKVGTPGECQTCKPCHECATCRCANGCQCKQIAKAKRESPDLGQAIPELGVPAAPACCDDPCKSNKLPENLPLPPTAAPPESPSTGQLAQPPSALKASQPAACPALVKQPCGGRRLFRRACR